MSILHTLQTHAWIYYSWVAVISVCVGSFLNVVIYRLPRMMEDQEKFYCRALLELPQVLPETYHLAWPLSHCRACLKTLKPWHNIPIISFLFLRGRCAYCHAAIAWRYPVVELLTVLLSLLVAYRFGCSLQAVFAFSLLACTIPMMFIDIDHQILPDHLTLLLLWIGLFASLWHVFLSPQTAIISAITGYGVFFIFAYIFKWCTGKEGLGQGDFKLLAALAAFVGWILLPLLVFMAALIGSIAILSWMIVKHKNMRGVPVPFGPYLIIAGWITLLFGHTLFYFYATLLGLY